MTFNLQRGMYLHMCVCVCVCVANKLEIHAKYHINPAVHIISFVFFRSVTDTHGSVRIATRPTAKRLRNKGPIPGKVKRLFSLQSSDGHMTHPAGVRRALSLEGTGAWARSSTDTSISCHRFNNTLANTSTPPHVYGVMHNGKSVSFHNCVRVFCIHCVDMRACYIQLPSVVTYLPQEALPILPTWTEEYTVYELLLFHYPFWEIVYEWSDEIGHHVVPNKGTPDVTDEQYIRNNLPD